jgi:hypothetical protein
MKRRSLRSETFDLRRQSAPVQKRLVGELDALTARLFEGPQGDPSRRALDPNASWSRTRIFRDQGGEAVGFCLLAGYERVVHGRLSTILRGISGILPEHRGGYATARFGTECVFRYRLEHPFSPLYGFGLHLHPTMYRQMVRFADVWPKPFAETPADVRALMNEIADSSGLSRVEGRDDLVRKAPVRVRQTEAHRVSWASSADPAVRYFLKLNPDYANGEGLCVLNSIGIVGAARAGLGIASHRVGKVLGGLRSRDRGATVP